jgi:hypothetical protein
MLRNFQRNKKLISNVISKQIYPIQMRGCLKRNYKHVMDIEEEQKRQLNQEKHDNINIIEYTDRVYKPTHSIEFNRRGEIVLYSATPLRTMTIYTKYPYCLYESFIPACIYMYYMNPFSLPYHYSYSFIFLSIMLGFPRVWHIKSLNQRIERLSLLRGGKVLKVESGTIYGDKMVSWVHTKEIRPLTEDFMNFDDRDNADFLNEVGQLKYELGVEADDYVIAGVNHNDYNLFFVKEGTVHQPELFEAAIKGYNIDTSDFSINTSHNERAYEPTSNT